MTTPKIRLLADRILIEPEDEETTTKGGIVIPDAAKEKPGRGKALAIGSGKPIDGKVQPIQVKVGERVLFSKYAGTNITLEGRDYLIMREEDVMGVIE